MNKYWSANYTKTPHCQVLSYLTFSTPYFHVTSYRTIAFDIVTIRLDIGDTNKSTIISAIYKLPNTDIINCTDHIWQYVNNLTTYNDVFIISDFNINILNHNLNTNIKYVIDAIFSLGLHLLINKSTRISDHSHSLIDNIYCNKKSILF